MSNLGLRVTCRKETTPDPRRKSQKTEGAMRAFHSAFRIQLISLAELHQDAVGGFRVQKGDLSAAGPFSGFFVNQPNSFFFELLQG